MTTPLIPQEIYLLERYTSVESLEQVRDAWRVMLDHVETLLDRFMLQLPPDYESKGPGIKGSHCSQNSAPQSQFPLPRITRRGFIV